jgi:hypothetical protein
VVASAAAAAAGSSSGWGDEHAQQLMNWREDKGDNGLVLRQFEARIPIGGEYRPMYTDKMHDLVYTSGRDSLEAFSPAESFTLGVVYASLNRTTRLVQFGADAAMQLAAVVAKVEKMVRSDPELTGYLYRQWVMEPPAAKKEASAEAGAAC